MQRGDMPSRQQKQPVPGPRKRKDASWVKQRELGKGGER